MTSFDIGKALKGVVGEIGGIGKRRATEKYEESFWGWVEKTYSPGDVDILRGYSDITGSEQWGYFLRNIYGLRPEHPDYPGVYEPLGPTPPGGERFGLTDANWRVLMWKSGSRAWVQEKLQEWITSGYINQYQARDIWNELDYRVRTKTAFLLYEGVTEEEWPAEYERRLKLRETEKERARAKRMGRMFKAYPGTFFPRKAEEPMPEPIEYGVGLEEMRAGLEEPEPYKRWFESKFSSIIARFKAKVPEEERKPKAWAEYLKRRGPELREEWYTKTPWERGERPSAFAPRVTTVRF